ncbi:MAG TPA: hypothetical protein VF832_07215, partial [Longimicrobiales bacterium]
EVTSRMPTRIDAPCGRVYRSLLARSRRSAWRSSALALALAFGELAGCAKPASPASPSPQATAAAPASGSGAGSLASPDKPAAGGLEPDTALARAAIAATAPKAPLKLVFGWSLQDRDAHFGGKAAARIEPPYRARLDLFGPRGEGYLSAAVVGEAVRIPPSAQSQAGVIPPPALLWTALGVLSPPADARLVATRRDGEQTLLEYARGAERWRFTLVGGALRRAEVDGAAAGRLTVELKGGGALGLPKQAVFRDYAAFRELTLTLDRADEAQSFPPDTWTPGGR